jgi:hypothetical protein
MPACCAKRANIMLAPGPFSDGLRTMLLPHTMDSGAIQSGIIIGKLCGQMPAVTPNGCR